MNHIKLDGDKIVVALRFDEHLVNQIRRIDGRVWNKYTKRWEIPVANVIEACEILEPLGFEISPDIMHLKSATENRWNFIDSIRAMEPSYAGNLPLRDFQKLGCTFLREMPAALLADVPGLGKSIQVLAAHENEPEQMLIWTYNSLKYNFAEEIAKWFPNAWVMVINGNKKERKEKWEYAMKGGYVAGKRALPRYVIANYELLLHDFELIKDHQWGWGVCDEATRISNHNALSVKKLKALKFKKKIAMTGTPVSNSPEDIFSIMDWIVPGYLGSYHQFRNKYCEEESNEVYTRGGGGQTREVKRIIGYKNIDMLSVKVSKFMLRRLKEEVLTDFPPKVVENIIFDLNDDERQMYTAIREQIVKEIREMSLLDTSTLHVVPVKMLRLKQCTGSTSLVDDLRGDKSTKMVVLKEHLDPIIKSGYKAIVFTQFKEMLHLMEEDLKEYRPLSIHGDVPAEERQRIVNEFRDDPLPRIILMTEAGAYGLNMQAASYVFHYDFPWSIAKLQQREDRAHRYGQDKTVTVYNLVAKNTIDEYCLKLLSKKNKTSVDILADVSRLEDRADLSVDDIQAILRL